MVAVQGRIARSCAGILIAVSVLTLAAWLVDGNALHGVLPAGGAMKANAAFVLALVGAVLLAYRARSRAGWARVAIWAVGGLTAALGAMVLLEYISGWRLGIDELLAPDPAALPGVAPGRVAPQAAVALVLTGAAIVLLPSRGPRAQGARDALAICVAIIGTLAIAGRISGGDSLYEISGATPIPLEAGVAFVLVSVALLGAFPDVGLSRRVASKTAGGAVLRRLLPVAVGIPLLLTAVTQATDAASLSGYSSQWLLGILLVVLVGGVSIRIAGLLDRSDRRRELADIRSAHANDRTRAAFDRAYTPQLMIDFSTGRFLEVNDALLRLFGFSRDRLLAENPWWFVHPDDQTREQALLADLLMGRRDSTTLRTRRRHIDGHWVPVEIHASRVGDKGGGAPLALAEVRDLTAEVEAQQTRERFEASLTAHAEAQAGLAALGRFALTADDISQVLDRAAAVARKILAVDYCSVLGLDRDSNQLRLAAGAGWSPVFLEDAKMSVLDKGTQAYESLSRDTPLVVSDWETETRFYCSPLLRRHRARSSTTLAISHHGSVYGVIGVASVDRRELTAHELAVLQELANLLGQAVEGRRAREEAERAWHEALNRLAQAVEFRDEETGAHITRMATYCSLIAWQLGIDEARCTMIREAAPMHDAGKVAIPDAILLKPGALSPGERDVMETHAEIGYRLLTGSGSELLELAATIARTHHEKYDGSGYPRRLAGEDIPIEGRVAAVADVFDALTSDRPYRPGMSLEKTLKIMRAGRGTHFDPDVLDAFLGCLDEIEDVRARCGDTPGVAKSARVPIGSA